MRVRQVFVATACLSVMVTCFWVDPTTRHLRMLVEESVRAAAIGDSASVMLYSRGRQPQEALQYVGWLRPEFLALLHRDGTVTVPTVEGDTATAGMVLRYRGVLESVGFRFERANGDWLIASISVPEFSVKAAGDPELQSDWADQLQQRPFPAPR